MESRPDQPWLADCQRVVAEFNDMAILAFTQEWGNDEAISIAMMQFHAAQPDIRLDVGPRSVFLVEHASGFVYKISSESRVHHQKVVGHITSLTGKELYRQQWW